MLEQALKDFEGTILFVSHDRYFINQLANKVFDLNYDGGQMYLGDYQYYIEKTEEERHLKLLKMSAMILVKRILQIKMKLMKM